MSQAPAAISPHTSTRVQARRRLGATGLALALVSTVTLWAAPAYASQADAPTSLVATPGDASLDIAFTAGNLNGDTLSNYEYSTNDGTDWVALSTPDTTSPITIPLQSTSGTPALVNGTTYQVKVRALTVETGAGLASDAVAGTPRTVPTTPTSLSITPGNASLEVAFTQTGNGGSAITNYEYSTNDGTDWVALSTPDTTSPITIPLQSTSGTPSLVNGTTYQVKVRARNAAGLSGDSVAAPGTPRTVPTTPTSLTITPGNASLEVAFTQSGNGGSAITNYEYSTNDGTDWVALSTPDTTSPITIPLQSTSGTPALVNGTTYQVKVRARNAAGLSADSAASPGTPRTVPGAPTITGISEDDQSLTVAFTAPTVDGGSSITNYQYSTDGGTTFLAISPTDTTTPLVITKLSTDGTTALVNGTAYSIKIKAVNAAGAGAASDALSGTPAAGCTLTTLGDIRFGDGSAKLSATQKAKLRVYAHRIADAGCTAITLNGHTSGLGNSTTLERIRTKITKARNAAVKKYLKAQLAKLEVTVTYTTHVYNAQRPKYPLNGPNAAKNRRVEIVMGPGAS